MIAPAPFLFCRPAPAILSRRALVALGFAAAVMSAACDKVPLTAPTGSTVTLFSNTTIVPINGAADITATVIEAGGTQVQNGTLVTFSTTIGQIDPAEARTRDGKVTVRLLAGTRSGRAVVRAFSGGVTSGDLSVDIGGAAAGSMNFTANPSNVPASGGTSTLLAVVFDADGNRLPGVPVSFTSTAGTLSSTVVVTNSQGEATTTITTNRDADVTASTGGASGEGGRAPVTATVKITASALPTVSVTATGTPVADTPTTFTVTAAATAPATVRSVIVDFGDGTVQTFGNVTAVAHTYRSGGTFTVTATVEDTNGGRSSGSTVVAVQASAPLVSLTVTSPIAVNAIATFTVTVTQNPGNVPVQSVNFEFGDGQSREVQSLSTTYSYASPGTYVAAATVRFTNGRTSKGLAQVRVN
jgi:PKD repeat protein